ncbi:MAG: acylphosphatase [Caldiserica bacterium]|nr:acylphosphatase [Caldisericota bacterium]
MTRRVHITVSGRVQGVFFRANTQEVAQRLGLSGYVRNLPDGRVEVVAEGAEEALRKLIEWCHEGPPLARVERVEVRWENPTGEFSGFHIRY